MRKFRNQTKLSLSLLARIFLNKKTIEKLKRGKLKPLSRY